MKTAMRLLAEALWEGENRRFKMRALHALAVQIARRLNATPAADPPARAAFDAGVIYIGSNEIAIEFTNVGHFFISEVEGQIIIDGVVRKELEHAEKRERHRKLHKWAKKIFGDETVFYDPLGYAGGPKSQTS